MTPAKAINITLDDDTYMTLASTAEDEDRTIYAQARRVLREWADCEREARSRRDKTESSNLVGERDVV